MNDFAHSVEEASDLLLHKFDRHESVLFTAHPSANGATVFLSCHLDHGDDWKCARLDDEGIDFSKSNVAVACQSIHSQNRFTCKVLGTMKPASW